MGRIGTWGHWGEIHEEQSQVKRIKSAREIDCTPLRINNELSTGVFQGRSSQYETSLIGCQCVDFVRNQKPCKHIYRLALEFGLLEGEFRADLAKITNQLSYEEALKLVETVTDESQRMIKEFLYYHLYHQRESYGFLISDSVTELTMQHIFVVVDDSAALFDPYGRNEINAMIAPYNIPGFKKNLKKEILIEWILSNASDIIPEVTNSISLTIHPQFTKNKRKLYSYLTQKFQEDTSWLWQ